MLSDILEAAGFGMVQGVTEFWPISSSGHLILFHTLVPTEILNSLSFDVALHLGTFLATALYFRREIRAMISAVVRRRPTADRRLAMLIALGTVPTLVIAWVLQPYAEGLFRTPALVAITLAVVGILFFVVERLAKRLRAMEELGARGAFLIGLLQGIAVIPGISRSGISIITGLALGLKRDAAARFSFLLSLPVIAAAGAVELFGWMQSGPKGEELGVFMVGFLISAAVGFVALRFLLTFLVRRSLRPFGVYRIALALVIAILLLR